jgi:hypothetical protein
MRRGVRGCYFFLDDDFRFDDVRFEEERFRGTFAPARRASESPIAIACLRLVTFFPERPLLSVPLFRSRIARATFRDAFLPYLATFVLRVIRFLPVDFESHQTGRVLDARRSAASSHPRRSFSPETLDR